MTPWLPAVARGRQLALGMDGEETMGQEAEHLLLTLALGLCKDGDRIIQVRIDVCSLEARMAISATKTMVKILEADERALT